MNCQDENYMMRLFYCFITFGVCITSFMYYLYMKIIFISIDGLNFELSVMVFAICTCCLGIIRMVTHRKRDYGMKDNCVDVINGAGIYTVITYIEYYKVRIMCVLSITLIFALLCICCVFIKNFRGKKILSIPNRKLKKKVITNRLLNAMDAIWQCTGITMIIIIVSIGCSKIKAHDIKSANLMASFISNEKNMGFMQKEYSLEEYIDLIAGIRSNESWQQLSADEKLQTVQAICNCEKAYFGLDCYITVVTAHLDKNILGTYNDSDKTIIIDTRVLEEGDAETILNTCLHEMFHAWEFNLVRLYNASTEEQKRMIIFNNCADYIYEINNYKTSEGDHETYMQYYNQKLEADSRAYAEEAVAAYYREIDRLLEE